MRPCVVLLLVTACGAAKPAGSASPSPTAAATPRAAQTTATPTAAPTAVPTPTPTGGSVFVGDIAAAKKFDPKAVIEAHTAELLDCYNEVRATKPALSGRLKLLIQVNEAGAVLRVDSEAGGQANDPALVACIGEALKATTFPKPGGMATVVAPLLFRP